MMGTEQELMNKYSRGGTNIFFFFFDETYSQ
jgi:hypothetical protein